MSSTAKISANRENARKSTGPRTERGKSKSKLNALKLGVYATTPVLPGEDEEAYREVVKSNLEYFAPVGPVENLLVSQITTEQWRLDRIQRAENFLHARLKEGQIIRFLGSLNEKEMAYVSSAYDHELSEQLDQVRHERESAVLGKHLKFAAKGLRIATNDVPLMSDEAIKDHVEAMLGRILEPESTLLEVLVPITETAPHAHLVHERRMAMRAYLAYVGKLQDLQEARLTVPVSPRPQPTTIVEKQTRAKRPARLSAEAANENQSEVVNSSMAAAAPSLTPKAQ